MKPKTVAQHLNDMPAGEARDKAMQNADLRYSNELAYTLSYALTFGVNHKDKADSLFW